MHEISEFTTRVRWAHAVEADILNSGIFAGQHVIIVLPVFFDGYRWPGTTLLTIQLLWHLTRLEHTSLLNATAIYRLRRVARKGTRVITYARARELLQSVI